MIDAADTLVLEDCSGNDELQQLSSLDSPSNFSSQQNLVDKMAQQFSRSILEEAVKAASTYPYSNEIPAQNIPRTINNTDLVIKPIEESPKPSPDNEVKSSVSPDNEKPSSDQLIVYQPLSTAMMNSIASNLQFSPSSHTMQITPNFHNQVLVAQPNAIGFFPFAGNAYQIMPVSHIVPSLINTSQQIASQLPPKNTETQPVVNSLKVSIPESLVIDENRSPHIMEQTGRNEDVAPQEEYLENKSKVSAELEDQNSNHTQPTFVSSPGNFNKKNEDTSNDFKRDEKISAFSTSDTNSFSQNNTVEISDFTKKKRRSEEHISNRSSVGSTEVAPHLRQIKAHKRKSEPEKFKASNAWESFGSATQDTFNVNKNPIIKVFSLIINLFTGFF